MEREPDLREKLQLTAGATARTPDALADRVEFAALGGKKRENAVRFAELTRTEDDRIGGVAAAGQRPSRCADPPARSVSVVPLNAYGRRSARGNTRGLPLASGKTTSIVGPNSLST